MHTDKISAIHLVEILIKSHVKDFIISPGSRNAPLINELVRRKNIHLFSIPDERSAGFYALGMALKTKRPTAVICTSGSALLNYLPAVSEAFYQNVPLIVISADRPGFRIDKGEGQTIRQKGALKNFIRGEFDIPVDEEISDLRSLNQGISELINLSRHPVCGPVHFNIAFDEPLYNHLEQYDTEKMIPALARVSEVEKTSLSKANTDIFNRASKVMIICGQMDENKRLEEVLNRFSKLDKVVVLTESTANLKGENIIPSIDKTVSTFGEDNLSYAPDLLISLGDAVVSKIIKRYLRKSKPAHHWQIHPGGVFRDTYDCLSQQITEAPEVYLTQLAGNVENTASGYREKWLKQYNLACETHVKILENTPFSDLKVFEFLLGHIPVGSAVHLSNSSPIRYQQLFGSQVEIRTFSNRGTSGIDGCLSTAAGFAVKNETPTWIITGDVSFLYDSNAWWNGYRPDLKVILINNGGGGIFRILPGPEKIPGFETFFETQHQVNIKELCSTYDLHYFYAGDLTALKSEFNRMLPVKGVSVLEIKTPRLLNARLLRNYFNDLKRDKNE